MKLAYDIMATIITLLGVFAMYLANCSGDVEIFQSALLMFVIGQLGYIRGDQQ